MAVQKRISSKRQSDAIGTFYFFETAMPFISLFPFKDQRKRDLFFCYFYCIEIVDRKDNRLRVVRTEIENYDLKLDNLLQKYFSWEKMSDERTPKPMH